MTIEEFIKIMDDNGDEFPEFASLTTAEKRAVANHRLITGPAEAIYEDERLVGVGGVSHRGGGEAWMITPRSVRSHHDYHKRRAQFSNFLKVTHETMSRMADDTNMWRLFATGKLSVSFLEKLGFERSDNTLIWSRKA